MSGTIDGYIFIGHGWDINTPISLKDYTNVQIIMLDYRGCLIQDPEFKHKKMLMKYLDAKHPFNYYNALYNEDKKLGRGHNRFCVYDSNTHSWCPNLLLTKYSKIRELSTLHKIGNVRGTGCPEILTLKELLELLGGKNFIIEIYACTSPLDEFQYKHIPEGFKHGQEIIDYIDSNKIPIVESDKTNLTYDCINFERFLKEVTREL